MVAGGDQVLHHFTAGASAWRKRPARVRVWVGSVSMAMRPDYPRRRAPTRTKLCWQMTSRHIHVIGIGAATPDT
ncbi:hypothetical protein I552_1741 [Mycobacterium xenopi 3993]|nr:hypothetical protein I552_1741 [Mycobacterium xenopi 3993]